MSGAVRSCPAVHGYPRPQHAASHGGGPKADTPCCCLILRTGTRGILSTWLSPTTRRPEATCLPGHRSWRFWWPAVVQAPCVRAVDVQVVRLRAGRVVPKWSPTGRSTYSPGVFLVLAVELIAALESMAVKGVIAKRRGKPINPGTAAWTMPA